MQSYNDWEYIRGLGVGGFGEVHLWRHRITNQEIATKLLKPNTLLRPHEVGKFKKRWLQEYNWMHSLQTPYIVGAIDLPDKTFLSYLQNNNHMRELPVIVMEYCNAGDLRSRLEEIEHQNGLHEKEIRGILLALRHAVEYLHNECNIEHRDIKPENIVIHRDGGGGTIYKLTDFGYAREIPEETIAQSVVGTRHYVAPEVIEPGSYTKTVDYWSVGVMTFELICGIRPFLPHKEFKVILTEILVKPPKSIAITQDLKPFQQQEKYHSHDKIFHENLCSPIFIERIEKWLQLALDGNYKTRGHTEDRLCFFTDLDSLLATKIITVFSLSSYEFYHFDATTFANTGDFFNQLSQQTQIKPEHIFITLPPLHPKRILANIREPIDFYVDEWSDTGNRDNPRAMLYVTDVKKRQCDYNSHRNTMNSYSAQSIMEFFKIDKQKYDKVPIWLLEEFERRVHYLLQNEQRYLECYIHGLYQFIISIEDEAFRMEESIQRIHENTLRVAGRFQQYEYTANLCAKMQNSQVPAGRANALSDKLHVLQGEVVSKLRERHRSLLRHCKALASREILQSLPKEDIYKLKSFREFLSRTNLSMASNAQRMNNCIEAVDRWATQTSKFPSNELFELHDEIMIQCSIYVKILSSLEPNFKLLNNLEKELESETERMLSMPPRQNGELITKMGSLCIDGGNDLPQPAPMSHNSVDSLSLVLNGHCQEDVTKLIENINNLNDSLMNVWGTESDDMCIDDSLPTTINDI
ncbi:inhibitor of nuclear factor kappa-B kinase subunit beta [Musca vetustissima]|uniref:inhibitor of nuclear factor kappa-B kinase subunit beta n=1 Tax=Musca vetustissima TaxID=27455 RepID=UPI002AB72499|nr:inhibitor of nuclear factor kappa-B kinase subunit beta [Musca vetustissima]